MYAFLANKLLDRSPLVDLQKEALGITKLLQSSKMVKINRKANMITHELAKFSLDNGGSDGILVSNVPPCWRIAVTNNCSNILI